MSFEIDKDLLDLIRDVLERMVMGCKAEIETKKYKVKAYNVNSSAKYAKSSIRIDIQDLEPRDYT